MSGDDFHRGTQGCAYRRLDVDFLELSRDGQRVSRCRLELQEHAQSTRESLETEQVVAVRRDLDLELRRGRRQSLGPSSLDLFRRLRVNMVSSSANPFTHILVQLETIVKAQLVELVRR